MLQLFPCFGVTRHGNNPQAKILTKKPVTATAEELVSNARSKPAKLRAIVKQ
jgi:16S rRNA C1402 N4-methylase RsmH